MISVIAKFSVIVLIGIVILVFPGFDWRHWALIVAQLILILFVNPVCWKGGS